METLYLKARPEQISKYVLFSGDPFRVEVLKNSLENPKHVAFAREFNTYTGTYKGVEITVTSTGIGAPSAAIAMEEMYNCGMEVAIRMGTVMGLEDDMLGKMFIPNGAMRGENVSDTYVEKGYPATPDFDLVMAMRKGSTAIGREVVTGITATLDGFYSQMKDSKLSKEMGFNHQNTFDKLKNLNIKGIDMESSIILVLANLMGIKGAIVTMTTVLENLKETLQGEARTKSEEDLCKAVLEGIYIYDKENGGK